MIDIHNHLLYGVDDGVRSFEESIKIIKELKDFGYDCIILTPHYVRNSSYCSTVLENERLLTTLKERLIKDNVDISLYLGNEIYIDEDIDELLNEKLITSLNNSHYLLIELPMSGKYNGYDDIFSYLVQKGYKIILAHPERYLAFHSDYTKIQDLKKLGVLFQCNIESIIGTYGNHAKNTIIKLLKDKYVDFLATDIHSSKNYSKWIDAKNELLNYITEDEYEDLISNNAKKILEDSN